LVLAIIVVIILVFINAFFAASEIALVGLNENKVDKQAEEGDKKAKMLQVLISDPSRFLGTIQIGITFAGFLASAFAADFFAGPLSQWLYNLGVPLSLDLLNTISVVAITILLSYFTLVFGELFPKQLALQKGDTVANFTVRPVTWVYRIFYPLVKFLSFSTNTVGRLFGLDPNAENEEATEEEIRLMVDAGGERGTIQKEEELMINNIFEFNDKAVSDIITHRTDMSVLPIDADLKETIHLVNEEKYTRFPVYEDDIDNIVGILHVKDLFEYIDNGHSQNFSLADLIRKPYFVLESKSVDVLLKDMQQKNMHISIVLDEYGGTEGLVTIEDVIEEIVGEIFSESEGNEPDEEEIKLLEPNKYKIDGIAHLYQLEDYLDITLPTDDFDTLSGFLINELGYIPTEEEKPVITYENILFEVTNIAENRIDRVIATIYEKESNEEDDDKDKDKE